MSVKLKLVFRCDTCGRKDKQFVQSTYFDSPMTLWGKLETNLPEGWTVKNHELLCDECTLKDPQVQ
jgi:hypothetical protein